MSVNVPDDLDFKSAGKTNHTVECAQALTAMKFTTEAAYVQSEDMSYFEVFHDTDPGLRWCYVIFYTTQKPILKTDG